MKSTILPMVFCFLTGLASRAQGPAADTALTGEYRLKSGQTFIFEVFRNKEGGLNVQIVGQGTTGLTHLSGLTYLPEHVHPKATIEFRKDSLGRIDRLIWEQEANGVKWKKIAGSPKGFAGDYRLDNDPYRILHIANSGGLIKGHFADEPDSVLIPVTKDKFIFNARFGRYSCQFKADKAGQIDQAITSGKEQDVFLKSSGPPPHLSNRANGFTYADTLQGTLSSLRSCYDVLFYDLSVDILPDTKSIRGSNTIRFKAVNDFSKLQVDLSSELHIDKIIWHDGELAYTRDYNAVFVSFPETLRKGVVDSIKVVYGGEPLEPDLVKLRGGIFWIWNRDKDYWIESVTQGIGASVFWPCKDHLSDRPDSMRIKVTIPSGLTEISNGRLLEKRELPGGQTVWSWYVDYPIVTYDVAINIGNYTHFSDVYVHDGDSLPLNFYCMPYNLPFARYLFGDARRMLALYYKDYGPYPFRRDGFTLVESVYPMEHQGVVSVGTLDDPINSGRYDTTSSRETMWHESAHEWWGNSVGCKDYAEMWINESFAEFSVYLNKEALLGKQVILRLLDSTHPENKEPIIGVYNVNNFHQGDMYPKGAFMLETLRNVMDNDSLFFSIFRGIQQRFRYRPVTTEDIVGYFNSITGKDYTWFFDQYLRHAAIPVLVVHAEPHGSDLEVRYKWEADVVGFRMPIKVTLARDSLAFIYPTTSWQTMALKGMTTTDFRVDKSEFYAEVRME
ncbi:MAG TPA: M1 family metallopeptidase [Puia sp.]|nr:M1 family metallopeptidase [Puia sp.]